ncbi:MAG TPA: SEL1-like repeat protein [Allosphingosinicella sp.]|jgi:hypothetical protein
MLIAFPQSSAWASSSYFGISLGAGGDPEVQALARKARDGDRRAQFELAQRFERGRGFPLDLKRAERLYLMASLDRGGTRYVYSPPQDGSGPGGTLPVSQGPRSLGLPEARAAWIRVRSERLAREAAEKAPLGLRDEAYLARKLAVDRQLGVSKALQLPVVSISGPLRLSGPLDPSPTEGAGELCAAMAKLVTHYRRYGFQGCTTYTYRQRGGGQATATLLRYTDLYREIEDDPSGGGHPGQSYKPPFTSAVQLPLGEPLCGHLFAFDVRLTSATKYRLIITDDPGPRRAAAPACPTR